MLCLGGAMSEPMDSDRRVAYHEAGHAVVAWCLDEPITNICIPTPDGQRGGVNAGYTAIGTEDGQLYRFAQEADSLFYAAGPAAELIEFDDCDPLSEEGDENPVHPRSKLLEIRELVKELLLRHWPAVETLAVR